MGMVQSVLKWFCAAVAFGSVACGEVPQDEPARAVEASGAADLEQIQQASISPATKTNPGRYAFPEQYHCRLSTKVWRCNVRNAQIHDITCTVDSGWVAIGGGAVTYNDGGPGAYLTASMPSSVTSKNGWRAISKDHKYANPHHLYVYVIGLQIRGVEYADLKSAVTIATASSPTAEHVPTATARLPDGVLMLSAGAWAHWYSSQGNILTAMWPDGNSVFAASKDHILSDPVQIHAYAVGIRPVIWSASGNVYVQTARAEGWTNSPSGYSSTFVWAPNGYLLAGGGAMAEWNWPGRLLTVAGPRESNGVITPEWRVTSKDMDYPDTGITRVAAYGIRDGNPTNCSSF